MESIESQIKKIEKRLDRAAGFGVINKKEFRKANRTAAKAIVQTTRSNLKAYKEDIEIHRNGKITTVKRDQLKKSIGVWFGNKSNTAFAGPRANKAGKTNLKKKVRDGDTRGFGCVHKPHPNATPRPHVTPARAECFYFFVLFVAFHSQKCPQKGGLRRLDGLI